MRRIQLIRHPPVDVPTGICYGRLDVPLVDDWLEKSPVLHSPFKQQDSLLICSPASRCQLLAAAMTPSIRIDERLQELDFGRLEGRKWDDIDRQALDHWAADFVGRPVPGGESYLALFHRVTVCLTELMQESPDLTLITHAGVIRACLCLMFRRRLKDSFAWQIPFASPMLIEVDRKFQATCALSEWLQLQILKMD